MALFDVIHQSLARARAEERFGGGSAAHGAAPTHETAPSSPQHTVTGSAAHGVYSPAVDTLLDERELYLARSGYFDSKAAKDPMLARAMARHRGEKVEDPAIKREPGAPKSTRPLADPSSVIASAVASARKPEVAAPQKETPYSGLSERDRYLADRASLDARAKDDTFLQRALARHAATKAAK